jgi:hypothetical protein
MLPPGTLVNAIRSALAFVILMECFAYALSKIIRSRESKWNSTVQYRRGVLSGLMAFGHEIASGVRVPPKCDAMTLAQCIG